MLDADINLFFVAVAAALNMLVGFVWYSPKVCGKAWMAAMGKSYDDCKDMKKEAGRAYGLSFLGALVMSFVLAKFVYFADATNFWEGALTGFWLWLGFVATVVFNSYLFEKKPFKLVLINAGYYLASLVAMSVVLAIFQ